MSIQIKRNADKNTVQKVRLSFFSREMGSAPVATAALWVRTSNPDISHQKYKIDDIGKGVANILYPAKKYRYRYPT